VNGKTTTTRFIAHIAAQTGKRVGYTCTDGIYLQNRRIDRGDCSGPQSAQNVLLNPEVDIAVLETARGGILRAGLGFDRCDVSVVTNIGEGDHLGLSDIDTLDKLARVKRTVVEATAPGGVAVLNAADALTAEMASYCPGSVTFFAADPEHPVVGEHRAKGGKAVICRDNEIQLCEGQREVPLVSLDRVPLTHGGRIGFQVENTLAAVAAAWALGYSRELIRFGLETFGADMRSSPGRFNLLEINGAAVIVDYGHNVSSLRAMVDVVEQFPHERRMCVYTSAGDRRDCDMVRQGELLAKAFDIVYLYEDQYMRGRKSGEIMSLLRQGMVAGGRAAEIKEVAGVFPAIQQVLDRSGPGDLVLVQADTVDESVAYVQEYMATKAAAAREIKIDDALEATKLVVPLSTNGESIDVAEPVGIEAVCTSAAPVGAMVVEELAAQVVD
jgi:cyanophycin synthetase